MNVSATSKIGAIVNASAGACKGDPALVARLQGCLPLGHVQITEKLEDLRPALEALRAQGIDTLAIVGGDGSLSGTLTALMRCWPVDRLPRIAVTRGGTVNTIASSLGAKGGPEAALLRLATRDLPSATPRPILQVTAGPDAEPRFGMIFANGAAARWLQAYYAGPTGKLGAGRLVTRTLASIPVNGSLSRQLFQTFKAELAIDGQNLLEETTLVACSTVRHVGLGFAPFLSAGDHPGRFHCLWTCGSPAALLREMPLFALGRYSHSDALEHRAPRSLRLSLSSAQPFTIDAELFEPVSELRVDVGPRLSFLAP